MKIVLTHDSDSIRKPFRHIWQRKDRFSGEDILLSALKLRNVYNNFEDIVDLEDRHGLQSTFFIPTFLFNIDEVIDTLKSIKETRWEVQLHYVHGPIQSQGLFQIQKEYFEHRLGSLEGVRVHNLEVTKGILEVFRRNGIIYDSSYRSETVGTYNLYTVKSGLVEIPVGIMDTDIFGRLMLDEKAASKYILRRIQNAEKEKASHFCILFHQESFRMKGGRIYKNLVKYLVEKGYETERCIIAAKTSLEKRKREENKRMSRNVRP